MIVSCVLFVYLYVMGLRPLEIVYFFSARIDFRRQNLTSMLKDMPVLAHRLRRPANGNPGAAELFRVTFHHVKPNNTILKLEIVSAIFYSNDERQFGNNNRENNNLVWAVWNRYMSSPSCTHLTYAIQQQNEDTVITLTTLKLFCKNYGNQRVYFNLKPA